MDPDLGHIELHIIFYFCHQGHENLWVMDKNTFSLPYDVDTQITYVKKDKD